MPEFLQRIKEEWDVITKAPLSFLILTAVCLGAGYVAARWYYEKQITEKDGQISRYRVALGIDKASEGALIELTNEEFRAKAMGTASKLRELCFSMRKREEDIQAQFRDGKIDKKGQAERDQALLREVSQDFARNLRSDAINVDNELRRRLGPKAVASIVGVLPSLASTDGTRISIVGLMPQGAGFDSFYLCQMAEGMEQMAKMLPNN